MKEERNDNLIAGLFLLFMYNEPAPSGGVWTPENNALTDWIREFKANRQWASFTVRGWLAYVPPTHFVHGAFILKEPALSKWGSLGGEWSQKLREYRKWNFQKR